MRGMWSRSGLDIIESDKASGGDYESQEKERERGTVLDHQRYEVMHEEFDGEEQQNSSAKSAAETREQEG